MTYANQTSVSQEKTRQEIERTLVRYGAESFAYMTTREASAISFDMNGRRLMFKMELPDPEERRFRLTPTGQRRSADAAKTEYDKAGRQRWRALLLIIKAKLEAVESGIVTFESEFLAHTVLPSGRTVFEETREAIEHAYVTGSVQPLQIEMG